MKKVILGILLLTFLFLPPYSSSVGFLGGGTWTTLPFVPWLSGYSYRKSTTLSRASGVVTNYQMKLLVGESPGATGEDVDCNSHIQSGFHDLAFTTSDGVTTLNYWIESITGISPNQLATIWIKFDSIGVGATTFYMYYGSLTLPDPIDVPTTCQWKRYPSNPILVVGAAGKFDDFWVQFNSIWKEGSTYYGYYQGSKNDFLFKIGLATSTDGITWTKDPTADGKVLDIGAGGEWDDSLVGYPLVWKEGTTWYMLYSGKKAATGKSQIGLATSANGITWTKSGSNPVITNGVSLDTHIMQPGTNIIKESSTYYFYYWGNTTYGLSVNSVIMLATSTDLITWTKSGNNPMLSSGGASPIWDASVLAPTVIKFGSTYYMWYEGATGASFGFSYVGIATSANKDSGWTKISSNPIFSVGEGTAWDNSWSELAIIINFGTEWRMYYGGSQGNAATPRCQGGFATYAKRGIGANTFIVFDDFERAPGAVGGNWTVDAGSPVISLDKGNRSCNIPNTTDMKLPATISNNIAVRSTLFLPPASLISCPMFGDGTHLIYVRVNSGNSEHIEFYTGAVYTDTGQAFANNAWHSIEVSDIILGTSIDIWYDSTKIKDNGATNWLSALYTNFIRFTSNSNSYLRNIIVRNFRTTEPVWGSWGSEEIQ